MNTVKVYLVRKPSDFEEVKTLCKKYTHEAEEVLIEETVNLPPTWYEALCQRFMSILPAQAIADIWEWEMKTYDEIMPNHKISVPMVYNHSIRVLAKLDRRLSRINTPALPLKYKYEINRLAHKLEQMVARYKTLEEKIEPQKHAQKD